jgi:hypothetical protein
MTPSEAIERAQHEVRVASTLFRDGLLPDCDTYLRRALRSALAAWLPAEAEATPEAGEQSALEALTKQGYRDVDRLRAALADGEKRANATLPRDFERVWAEAERLVRFSVKRFEPVATRRKRRRMLGALGALLLVGVVFFFFGERLWGRVRARASAAYAPDFPAAYAVDGIDTTEWLLPDGALGWLDVYLPHAKDVHEVMLLNGHNRFYLDRATRRVRVTAYAGNRELRSAESEFTTGVKDGRNALVIPLVAEGVTRVRIEVLSFFGGGGTLAEVEVR